MIDTDQNSRFQNTDTVIIPLLSGVMVETFGTWNPPSFIKKRPTIDNIGKFQVVTGQEGRPDLISTQIYGTPLLDWVLIAFNNTYDVLNWPAAGAIIEYPLPSIVLSEVD